MPPVRLQLALIFCAGGLATGCAPAPTVVRNRVLHLRIDEYSVHPRAIEVPPGRLKIVLRNTGILSHNLRLIENRPGRGHSQIVLGGTPTVKPGETVTAKVPTDPAKRLKRGSYKLLDGIANQADLGDYATLIVK